MRRIKLLLSLIIVLISLTSCIGEKENNMSEIKEIVKPFYTDALTVNTTSKPQEVLGELLSDDFQSLGSVEVKGKETLIGQLGYFWKLIPDLKWEIQEMIVQGNQVVVRSIATGTPDGDFMGSPTDGSKTFKIMTIDIHTVENRQITKVYHLEDWGTAMVQLK